MVPTRQKGFAEVMRVSGLEGGGQSWVVCLGPISPCESQTAENLLWLWSEQEVALEVGSQRCDTVGFEDGHGGGEPRTVGGGHGFSPGASRPGGSLAATWILRREPQGGLQPIALRKDDFISW